MKLKIILLFVFVLFIQCKGEKIEKISTKNTSLFFESEMLKFQFFSDNTYLFTVIKKDEPIKSKKYKGSCYFKNDTIYFKPFYFEFNRSEKAVIKNNFIEFINPNYPVRLEIEKNLFHTKSKLDLKKYLDYAFFSFDAKYLKDDSNYKSNHLKPADLNQKELVELDQILKKCFSDNASKLRKFNQYINQCIVVINEKQEKEILIKSYCKDPYNTNEFKYSLIMMDDGGNCNIGLKVNLTKRTYSDLHISGSA
ncbi:hypothetical protein IRZ71_21135 [Flavobacterium sp. ANB]|uniref:hypothetical protein n=1 Tax=unclassified Flavobacterium TaxID=196869 RepID=UPI0012B74EA2|nr:MULTISPECIES: hypothetical protein [unclassified Flavobacterium]MBF4518869.1 hypothetical protein [Flavobacterium sp. ANB]MTD71418.1 hypothetical protein [Flavobacterium sp. LC2016-13]